MVIRIDTAALKAKLSQLLNSTTTSTTTTTTTSNSNKELSNRDKYWTSLRLYFAGRMSRTDLDKQAMEALGKRHLHLHNHLIMSIHHNSQPSVPPPASALGSGGGMASDLHHPHSQLDDERDWAVALLLRRSLTRGQVRALIQELMASPPLPLLSADSSSFAVSGGVGVGDLSVESRALPSLVGLKQRMQSYGDGLSVANDAVCYLSMAVECHVKCILSRIISKTRSHNRRLFFPHTRRISSLPVSGGGGGKKGNEVSSGVKRRRADVKASEVKVQVAPIEVKDLIYTLNMDRSLVTGMEYHLLMARLSCLSWSNDDDLKSA